MKASFFRKVHQGFTIVELMVACLIVYVLAGLAYPSYQTYRDKARFSEAIIALRPLRVFLTSCVADHSCLMSLNGTPLGAGSAWGSVFRWGVCWATWEPMMAWARSGILWALMFKAMILILL